MIPVTELTLLRRLLLAMTRSPERSTGPPRLIWVVPHWMKGQ